MSDDECRYYTWTTYGELSDPSLEMPDGLFPDLDACLADMVGPFIVSVSEPTDKYPRRVAWVYWYGGTGDWNAYMEDGPTWVSAPWGEGDKSLGEPDFGLAPEAPRPFLPIATEMEELHRRWLGDQIGRFQEGPFTQRARTSVESWAVERRAANA